MYMLPFYQYFRHFSLTISFCNNSARSCTKSFFSSAVCSLIAVVLKELLKSHMLTLGSPKAGFLCTITEELHSKQWHLDQAESSESWLFSFQRTIERKILLWYVPKVRWLSQKYVLGFPIKVSGSNWSF